MKMEGGGPLRSPLGQHHQPNQMDYSLSSMSRFPGFHPMPNQTSLQPASQEVRDPLRVGSGDAEVGNQQMGAGHMLSPGQEHNTASQEHMRSHHAQEELRGQQDNRGPVDAVQGESRTGSGGVDHRLGSNSPSQQQQAQQQQAQQQQQQAQQQQQQANMDPNNAAYLALRNHPETTIRPISSDMRSPGADNEQQSPRAMEENLFKQVSVLRIGQIWSDLVSFKNWRPTANISCDCCPNLHVAAATSNGRLWSAGNQILGPARIPPGDTF